MLVKIPAPTNKRNKEWCDSVRLEDQKWWNKRLLSSLRMLRLLKSRWDASTSPIAKTATKTAHSSTPKKTANISQSAPMEKTACFCIRILSASLACNAPGRIVLTSILKGGERPKWTTWLKTWETWCKWWWWCSKAWAWCHSSQRGNLTLLLNNRPNNLKPTIQSIQNLQIMKFKWIEYVWKS